MDENRTEFNEDYLKQAIATVKERMQVQDLSDEEVKQLKRAIENLHYTASMAWTMQVDAEDKIRKDERIKLAKGLKAEGLDSSTISKLTGLTAEEIEGL